MPYFACTRSSRIVNFTPGRATAHPRQSGVPKGMPRSRWIRAYGSTDQVVECREPAQRSERMTSGGVRPCPSRSWCGNCGIGCRGAGVSDAGGDAGHDAHRRRGVSRRCTAELYGTRWRVEEHLKALKQTMKMDVLKCMTVDGVLKELTMYAVAYNLVRVTMCQAAGRQGVGGGPGEFHRRTAVANGAEAGSGDAGVGRQSVASRAV